MNLYGLYIYIRQCLRVTGYTPGLELWIAKSQVFRVEFYGFFALLIWDISCATAMKNTAYVFASVIKLFGVVHRGATQWSDGELKANRWTEYGE